MNTFYICEPGIKLCEQPIYTTAPGFVSYSFYSASLSEAWSIWKKLSIALSTEWPVTIKWRTVGDSLEQQKIQEIRLRKDIEKTLGKNGFIKKNEQTKIYSYLNPEKTEKNEINPNELTQYRNTFLILKKQTPDMQALWDQLSNGDKGVTSNSLFNFLTLDREALIGRFLESDTHSTAQLISPIEYHTKINSILEKINITKTTEIDLPTIISHL
ncbi:hypothetical protein [Pseudomonas syringae]